MPPFFATIPHAGETVPDSVSWLKHLPEPVLMRDVDRSVDQLYVPVIQQLKIPSIVADCHRYVIDLNRHPHEFDAQSVQGATLERGTHPKGLHWSVTTHGETLIPQPMKMELHEKLVEEHYNPFHDGVRQLARTFAGQEVFHLDLHSMPSQGTAMHNDPGTKRADVVISDFHGKSARADFVELIKAAYQGAGFSISYNWPYFGGGITQMYGRPDKQHHTVQVELNRALYMNEETKQKSPQFEETQRKLSAAIKHIHQHIQNLKVSNP